MRRVIYLAIIILSMGGRTSYAQTLHQQLDSISKQENLCGISIVALALGEPVYSYQYGYQDIARHIYTTDSTRYRVASISKMITTIALMQLYEKKLCTLDEDVSIYLGFPVRNPNYPEVVITLRMLLSHTSSLTDGDWLYPFANATFSNDPPPPISDLLMAGGAYFNRKIYGTYAPGTYFSYANINFAVIGTVVEKLSGERFDIYCANHIFNPLHLHCSFNINAVNLNTLAPIYRFQNNTWTPQYDAYTANTPLQKDAMLYTIGTNALLYSPLGGLRASAKELAVIIAMLAHNGTYHGVHILNDTTVKRMEHINWQYDGTNGDANNALFQAWASGMHVAQSHSSGDIVFPNDTMRGHMGDAYGLISDVYTDKRGNGLVMITNGKVEPFSNDSSCACYRTERQFFNTIYDYLQACVTGVAEIRDDSGLVMNIFLQPATSGIVIKYTTPYKTPIHIDITNLNDHILATQKLTPKKTLNTSVLNNTMLKQGFYNIYIRVKDHTYEKLIYWKPPTPINIHTK